MTSIETPPTTAPARRPARRLATDGSRLPALTGLRFVAACHVVLFHMLTGHAERGPWWLRNIVASGYVGVSLFFVLSGFILAYTYIPQGERLRSAPREFWVARFARVYPVYALGLVIALPFFIRTALERVSIGGEMHGIASTGIASLLLLQSWGLPPATDWNAPGWSLSDEAFFYLLFPLIGGYVAALSKRALMGAAVGACLAALVAPLVYLALAPDGAAGASVHSSALWISTLKYNPLLRLPEFVAGVVTGKLFLDARLRRPTATATRASAYTSSSAALAVVATLAFADRIPYALLHNGLLAPLFAVLIYGLAGGGGPVAWLLSRPLLVLLGEASYALYILHVPLSGWHELARTHLGLGKLPFVVDAALYAAAAIAASVMALKLLETPARRVLRRRLAIRARTTLIGGAEAAVPRT